MSLGSFFSSGDLFHPSTWDNYDPIGQVEDWGHSAYNRLTGNPDAIKAAYDKAIQASQQNAAQIRDFLGQGKQQAQSYYAPLQHMFQGAYGTEGIQAPMIPKSNPLQSAYGGKR